MHTHIVYQTYTCTVAGKHSQGADHKAHHKAQGEWITTTVCTTVLPSVPLTEIIDFFTKHMHVVVGTWAVAHLSGCWCVFPQEEVITTSGGELLLDSCKLRGSTPAYGGLFQWLFLPFSSCNTLTLTFRKYLSTASHRSTVSSLMITSLWPPHHHISCLCQELIKLLISTLICLVTSCTVNKENATTCVD